MEAPFEFQQLFPDLQWEVIMKMDDPELLNLCQSSHKMEDFCNNKDWFWKKRIESRFGRLELDDLQKMLTNEGTWFQVYLLLVRLTKLKIKLKLDYTLPELYNQEELYLNDNQLTDLPKEIGNLTNLQTLYLSSNQISDLPKEIGNLTNLEILYLNDNQLTDLPKEIGNLTNLKRLYLNDNQLTDLPKEIGNLHNLKELFTKNNPLVSPDNIEQLLPNTFIF